MRRPAPLLALCLLLGCGSPTGLVGYYTPGEPFWISPGQTIVDGTPSASVLPPIAVRFVRVVGDSRCPLDVVCVWAGEATIEVGVRRGDGEETIVTLNAVQEPHGADVLPLSTHVELLQLDRQHLDINMSGGPRAQLRVDRIVSGNAP